MGGRLTRSAVSASLVALLAGGVSAPVAAQAQDTSGSGAERPRCTITQDQRAAVRVQIRALQADLARRLTTTELRAFHHAVRQLYRDTRDAKLSLAERRALRARFVSLAHQLGDAKTAAERLAIRTEMRAIAFELWNAKLSRAERDALRQQILAMRLALRPPLTRIERAAILAKLAELRAQLRCRVI